MCHQVTCFKGGQMRHKVFCLQAWWLSHSNRNFGIIISTDCNYCGILREYTLLLKYSCCLPFYKSKCLDCDFRYTSDFSNCKRFEVERRTLEVTMVISVLIPLSGRYAGQPGLTPPVTSRGVENKKRTPDNWCPADIST